MIDEHRMSEPDWQSLRKRFPLLEDGVFLDTATFGPVSVDAAQAARRYYDEAMHRPGEAASESWYAEIDRCREQVADLLGAGAHEIGFVPNTSTAISIAALLFEGHGAVLVAKGEHPSVVTPWHARRYRVDVAAPDELGRFTLGCYQRAIRPDTKVICVSHVRFNDGQVNDLKGLGALCKAYDIRLVVDAIQSLPIQPLYVADGIDVVGFGAFKWFNAGHGAGVLYVRDGLIERYGLPIAGRRSRSTSELIEITQLDPLPKARAFELGAICVPGILSLGASLKLIDDIGTGHIHKRVGGLVERFCRGLGEPQNDVMSAIVPVGLPDAVERQKQLAARGIHVALRGGRLRIAVSWYNTEDDIDRLLGALKDS